MTKHYISADELFADSLELALRVLESGFRPNFLVGVWRGGAPVAIAVQELMEYCGVTSDHIAIRTSSYDGVDQRDAPVRVHGLGYLVERLRPEDRVLVVDDVWDTGLSLTAAVKALAERTGDNHPRDVRTATVYFKPGKNRTDSAPDFYVHENDDWLIFPHELCGLEPGIVEGKPGFAPYVERVEAQRRANGR